MLVLKRAIDRMLGSIMRRITKHWYEWAWRDPGAALRNELQRRATLAAADFVTTRMPDALYCGSKLDLLSFALKQAPPGLALEFGVFKGTTINHLARQAPDGHFFGFDSFAGLRDRLHRRPCHEASRTRRPSRTRYRAPGAFRAGICRRGR